MSEDYSWGSVASSQASERATMETADWSGEEDAWSEGHQQEIPIFREIFGYEHVPLQPADIDWEPSSEEENADVGPV